MVNKEDTSKKQSYTSTVDERRVVDRYGKQLRQVAKDRDTYVTTEQLKANLKTLKSLQNRKG